MKINSINNTYLFSFKSLRTDKKQVEVLKNGNMPILENKKENILASLNNMTVNPERNSIEFLLDVAKNLQYGQNGNSGFKDAIDEGAEDDSERENTDWSAILADTIQRALNSSTEDVSDLQQSYDEIFNTKQPLTPEQKEVIELRAQLKKTVIGQESLEDADTLDRSARISRNIDFFISSSEIPLVQKKECLEKFLYFMSDEYKITPQLADKKTMVVDEMLNDMLIKTPGEEDLTTKTVNQLYSGICAAISICRKAIAYENKPLYMDVVMEELKDSPVMEVFDITDLGSGNKVSIPKINIDYDNAIYQGYRILDASAHNWMQNAHSSGDGTIQSETYVAFDSDNYGIFDDTSWYEGLNPEFSDEKVLLKSLIKENETLESVLKSRRKIKNAGKQVMIAKKQAISVQSKVNGKLAEIFSSIFPEMSDADSNVLKSNLMKFYKGSTDDNEQNISEKMPPEVKQQVLVDFIKGQISVSKEQEDALNANSKLILTMVDEYVSADNNVKKLESYNSKKGQYSYYKKLYNLAAAHRLAVESAVNLRDGVSRFEKLSGLPPRDIQVSSYMKQLSSSLSSDAVRQHFNKEETEKTEDEMRNELYSDMYKIETAYPGKLDSISKALFGQDITEFTKALFTDISSKIQNGDTDIQERMAYTLGVKNDKVKVLSSVNKWIEKLDKSSDDTDIQQAVRILGFENRYHMMKVFVSSFIASLRDGISEEQFNTLAERFDGPDKVASSIEEQRSQFLNLLNDYENIIQKWEVPSSRELIIQNMEKSHFINTESQLRTLQSRFDFIRHKTSENNSIHNTKQKKQANEKLYQFTNDELDIINSIEKSLPDIKKYCKSEYQSINQLLFDALEEQYSDLGMLNGQFWVREEGSSGLAANEQVRIIEQMTGKPYHIQPDIEKAVKQIKTGDGSGIISYSVDDASYAFHAQYAPSVTSERFTNPVTGVQQIQDVLWTDNSWGKSEKEYFWNGHNGFNYTDYGQGFGWERGFILSNDMNIGQPVETIKNAVGVDSEDKDKFGLFLSMVLPGMPVNAYQKLYKMFSYILTMKQGAEYYSALETSLKDGYKVNVKALEALDDMAELRTESLRKRIDGIKSQEDYDKLPKDDYLRFIMELLSIYVATDNPMLADAALDANKIEDLEDIKQEFIDSYIEEFGAIIAKNDKTIDNLVIASSSDISGVFSQMKQKFGIDFSKEKQAEIISSIFYNEEELDKINGTLSSFENYLINQTVSVALNTFANEDEARFFIDKVQKIIRKSIDDTLRIKSLDSSVLVGNPLHNEFIAAIDKYLKPKSDEEMLMLIQELQNADYDTVEKFLSALQPEDLGLEFKNPYEYIQKIQAGDSAVIKAFDEVIATNVIYAELRPNNTTESDENDDSSVELEGDEEAELATPEDLYRNLYVKLTEMDVQKYINKFKAEAFAKYKVRQAFPQPVVFPESEIAESVGKILEYVDKSVISLKSDDFVIKVFDKYESLLDKHGNTDLFTALAKGKTVVIADEETIEAVNSLKDDLISFANLTSPDSSLDVITKSLQTLISLLSSNDGEINGRKASKAINELAKTFASWEASSITKQRFIQTKKEELSQLRQNLDIMINTNISPAYRNEASEKLKNIISLLRNDAPEDELEYYKDDFYAFVSERHIVKNPTVLLKECVTMLQNGKGDSDEYQILKSYLIQALRVAQQTKIQYKLVQNAHDGISSKTKEMLPMFSVLLSNGEKKGMDSEEGMLYLIEQLNNESDDHTTLKLFLQQSGLSKLALKAIINNFNIEQSKEMINEKYDTAVSEIADISELNKVINEFFSKSRIPFISLSSALSHLRKFVARKYKNKDSEVLQQYLNYFDSLQLSDDLKNTKGNMLMPLVHSINEDILRAISEETNKNINYIADVSDLLSERLELMNVIDVPESSEEYKARQEFLEQYDSIQEYIMQKLNDIKQLIESSNFISAEYVE